MSNAYPLCLSIQKTHKLRKRLLTAPAVPMKMTSLFSQPEHAHAAASPFQTCVPASESRFLKESLLTPVPAPSKFEYLLTLNRSGKNESHRICLTIQEKSSMIVAGAIQKITQGGGICCERERNIRVPAGLCADLSRMCHWAG